MPGRSGLAIGIATAAYGLGAMLFSFLLDETARKLSGGQALVLLAGVVLAAGILASLAFHNPGAAREDRLQAIALPPRSEVALLWLVYFLGATGGLMAIGHAAGIHAAVRGGPSVGALAPVILALGNVLGSWVGGASADVPSGTWRLAFWSAVSAVALLLINAEPMALIGVGLCYGALIAFIPAYITRTYGPERSAAVFGRVFTAWGASGLLGPWIAGIIFDATGTYTAALLIAAALAASGAILALWVRAEA